MPVEATTERPIEIVLNWISSTFAGWIKKNGMYEVAEVIKDEVKNQIYLKISSERHDLIINFDDPTIQELSLAYEEARKTKLKRKIMDAKNIIEAYRCTNNKFISPLLSDIREFKLDQNKMNITFFTSEDNNKIFVELSNNLSPVILYTLIEEGLQLEMETIKESEMNFSDCFKNMSFVSIEFNSTPTEYSDDDLANVFFSVLFDLQDIVKGTMIPKGFSSSKLLESFKFLSESGQESAENDILAHTSVALELPLNLYDIDGLIYYFTAKIHEDFRYKYLDYYHVLEYYFNKISISNIKELIEEAIKNPSIFYDEHRRYDLSEKIKYRIDLNRNEKVENEEKLIIQILHMVRVENIIQEFCDESPKQMILPKIVYSISGQKEKGTLSEIKVGYKVGEDKFLLGNQEVEKQSIIGQMERRIYKIRNAIAHSKNNYEWRIDPKSLEIRELDSDLKLISLVSKLLLRYYCSRNH